MDQPLYDVYFTGKLVDGADPESAKSSFAKLFKAAPDAVEKFFNGKPQLLKRAVTKEDALKYKAALHKAGMMVAFKAHQTEIEQPSADTAVTVEKTPDAAPLTQTPVALGDQIDWSLAPVGSDVLKPDERRVVPEQNIDTSAIKLASAFTAVDTEPQAAPPAPDTSHISVAEIGADILEDKPDDPPPLPLDLDAITLAPPGTELEELHEDLPPVNPDISSLSMAEVGVDILEGQSKTSPPPPPDTDHLKIVEEGRD